VDNPEPKERASYWTRNVVLALIAAAAVVAAAVRVMQPTQPPAASPAAVASPGNAPAGAQPAAAAVPAAGSIDVSVAYAGSVTALPASAKLFVFVRPVGERIPLGAHSYDARELPLSLAFSKPTDGVDREVEVVARLSLSGSVTLQPGDVEAVSAPLRFGDAPQSVGLTLAALTGAAPVSAAPAAASAPATAPAATGEVHVPVRVELGAGVALDPTTVVYVIARASDGNPMPLAVKRLSVADLPADVVLSDADAMTAGRSLSGAGRIELVARATRSGDVKAMPGDYETRSGALAVASISAPIVLVLDRPL
jgi:hypothetical protein